MPEASGQRRPSQQIHLDVAGLDPNSYTAQLLRHATPDHLYLTSRRLFIGPIPEGWLKSHRRDWYKHHIHLNYSSRAATFSAGGNVSNTRRLTGIDGPSSTARYGHSFTQPADIRYEEEEGARAGGEATTETPPAVSVPRASNPDNELGQSASKQDAQASGQSSGARKSSTVRSSRKPSKTPKRAPSSVQEVSPTALEGSGAPENEVEGGTDDTDNTTRISRSLGESPSTLQPRVVSTGASSNGAGSSRTNDPIEATTSTSELIPQEAQGDAAPPPPASKDSTPNISSSRLRSSTALEGRQDGIARRSSFLPTRRKSRNLVHFDVPEDSATRRDTLRRRRRAQDGQVIKMERMLVRVDVTPEQKLPEDYDENESQEIITGTRDKWREFMIVCRKASGEDSKFLLQMYQTRVIPAIPEGSKKRPKHEIVIDKRFARINLFSSLDKTLVMWGPSERGYRTPRTLIYLLRARSGANAVEWYTFLRDIMGWHRIWELPISIPDLSVSLRIQNPFEDIEVSQKLAQDGENALERTMKAEEAVASNIVQKCLQMLEKSPEWGSVVDDWIRGQRIGLAWKRYDRLEWVHGINEKKMYGSIAMMKSHDLELRPKEHYPTVAQTLKGNRQTEPAPVEGFLIRLTSQKGYHQRMGKLFFKRLYFSTHDQYLIFSRPSNAYPPPPPTLPVTNGRKSSIPTAQQIAAKIPIIYSVNPYPVKDNAIEWLSSDQGASAENRALHDQDASDEVLRRLNTLLTCDGYIDLCSVVRVRHVQRGATPVDARVDSGSDVNFDASVPDTVYEDGATKQFDDDRTFEIVLRNGLVIRLQAFDSDTKKEWMRRLQELKTYWQARAREDIDLHKQVRNQNLDKLRIDEETEALFGQFARKWEVGSAFASPLLHHMCVAARCRSILRSGALYRKPRRRATFTLCHCILVPSRLLIFAHTMRSRTGKEIPSIHHDLIASVDLKEVYLYSGLLTEGDLLYRNRTVQNAGGNAGTGKVGHGGLPRIWLAEGGAGGESWSSCDEDVMCSFVLWVGTRKGFFRAPGKSKDEIAAESDGQENSGSKRARLKRVSQLGVKGRSIVFKARSRAERDEWVLAIGMEIERMQEAEDVRFTNAAALESSGKGKAEMVNGNIPAGE